MKWRCVVKTHVNSLENDEKLTGKFHHNSMDFSSVVNKCYTTKTPYKM